MADSPENIVPISSAARSAAKQFGAAHDRELLTILFTDLVDSTKLQSELGNVEAARITELHRKIVRDELARYDAREIEWAGDSCLAVFTKPSDAVVFALRMQAAHRRSREFEPKLPLVRVGMHLGEIVVKKRSDGGKKSEDLFGLQVSEAARVMSVARGDQIFCTRAVFDNARSALKGRPIEDVGDAVWVNYGAFLLKGSSDPVELCEIGSADVDVMKAPETNDKVTPVLPGGVEAMRALIPYEEPRTSARGVPRIATAAIAIAAVLVTFFALRVVPSASPEAPDETPPQLTEPKPLKRFEIDIGPVVLDNFFGLSAQVAVSPDGSRVAYAAAPTFSGLRRLYIVDLVKGQTTEVPDSWEASVPFFSPDGESVGFSVYVESEMNENRLMTVSVDGGTPTMIGECLCGSGATWVEDGTIVYAGQDEDLALDRHRYFTHLFGVSATGGNARRLTKADGPLKGEWSHHRPFALPGGRGILFNIFTNAGVHDIALLKLDSGEYETIIERAQYPQYAASGHVLFIRDEALWAVPFDLDALRITGDEAVVLQGIQGEQTYAVSKSGALVYVPTAEPREEKRELVWVDLNGNETNVKLPLGPYIQARVSPQGNRIALTMGDYEFYSDTDIWLHDMDRPNSLARLTTEQSGRPVWLPDGRRLIYGAVKDGVMNMFVRRIDGLGEPQLLHLARESEVPVAVSSMGDTVFFGRRTRSTNNDLHAMTIGEEIARLFETPMSDRQTQILLQTPEDENDPSFSADGNWMAYSSYIAPETQTFVRPYPEVNETRWQVSTERGGDPQWAPGGTEIYYWTDGEMMAVEVTTEPSFSSGTPRALFEGDYYRSLGGYRSFDLHPDGDRFLMIKPNPEMNRRHLVYIENWTEELKRLAPPSNKTT